MKTNMSILFLYQRLLYSWKFSGLSLHYTILNPGLFCLHFQFLLNEDSHMYKNQAELANSLQQELQLAQVRYQLNTYIVLFVRF